VAGEASAAVSDRRYHCPGCGRTFPLAPPRWGCDCGSHLNLTPGAGLSPGDVDTRQRSLWRYARALAHAGPAITLGEGWTPLIEASWHDRPVLFKLEFVSPSGSFKDRGASVLLSYLRHHGITSVMEDSSGNGGAAVATYAAAGGMACTILAPATTSPSKIVQIAAGGARVTLVPGTRQAVAEAALREAATTFYASHNRHPFFLEGTKTIGYEIWEQCGFEVPDAIVTPVGGGSALLGCHLAFTELLARGEVSRLPRIFGVQAARCAPIDATFRAGGNDLVPTVTGPTMAEGIATTRPVHLREVLDALRDSGGRTVTVEEDAIVRALGELARLGFFVEPTSAAGAAGLSQLLADGAISPGERVVLLLTGSGLKAAETIGRVLKITAAC